MNEIQTTQAERLRQLHSEIIVTLNITLDKAIEAGGILRDVKGSLPHGEFGKWVDENTGFNIRTAQRYMKVFDNRDQLKSDSVSYLNHAHKLLTATKEDHLFESKRKELERLEKIIESNLSLIREAGLTIDDFFNSRCMKPASGYSDSFFIPPPGCGLIFYTDNEEGNIYDFVIVVPSGTQGYYFRSWNDGQEEDGGQIVGDTRGINIEHIKLGCPLSQGTWERIVVKPGDIWAGPWDKNRILCCPAEEFTKYLTEVTRSILLNVG